MKLKIVALVLLLALVFSSRSFADIIVKTKTTARLKFGIQIEAVITEYIKSDKSRAESVMRYSDSTMEVTPKDEITNSIHITRLDKKLIWIVDDDKEIYRELDIKALSEDESFSESDYTLDEMDSLESETMGGGVDRSLDITESDKREVINDFECTKIVITSVGIDTKNPKDSTVAIISTWWNDDFRQQPDIVEYHRNYMNLLGSDDLSEPDGLDQLLLSSGPVFPDMTHNVCHNDKVPIKSTFSMEIIGGLSHEDQEIDKLAVDKIPAVLREMIDSLQAFHEAVESGERGAKVITTTTEIISIDIRPIDDSIFEIPVGYAKH